MALLPDDLAPQQVPLSLQEVDDVPRQRAVGLAPEVGHVDGDPAPGRELGEALREDGVEHAEVGVVVGRDVTDPEGGLVLLAGEVGR